MINTQRLHARLARLELDAQRERSLLNPVLTPEQERRAREIYERTYSDPVRYANRIAIFERIKRERQQMQASRGTYS